jgi:hypothetical protein
MLLDNSTTREFVDRMFSFTIMLPLLYSARPRHIPVSVRNHLQVDEGWQDAEYAPRWRDPDRFASAGAMG